MKRTPLLRRAGLLLTGLVLGALAAEGLIRVFGVAPHDCAGREIARAKSAAHLGAQIGKLFLRGP